MATIVSFTATEIVLKFLAGADTIDLKMTPRDDVQAEAAETLKLSITADAANSGYAISAIDNTSLTTILANDTTVINTNDSGEGSLRQAIINANAFAGRIPSALLFQGLACKRSPCNLPCRLSVMG